MFRAYMYVHKKLERTAETSGITDHKLPWSNYRRLILHAVTPVRYLNMSHVCTGSNDAQLCKAELIVCPNALTKD